ncbi:MAG: Ldh family oxidoreductase [Phycisphaeraceae bacterium]|nr:Ldh family oxidoreductase [Phycisphaeraceae bacterium]
MPTIARQSLEPFVRDIFIAKSAPADVADMVARSLVLANLRGHDSHGVIRVIQYVDWMDQGWICPQGKMEVTRDQGPILMVDGHFQFGQVIGRKATELAVSKAKSLGLCVLTVRRSAHLGRIGEFMEQAADAGVVAWTLTNTHGGGVLQAAHGGYEPKLSANPLAAAAPLPDGRAITMDFATSITAEGKVKLALARGEQLPAGYLVDGRGKPTTDPATYYGDPKGAILPVAGHKGYSLAVFADIFAGAIAGGCCSHANIDQVANGWFALFIDPRAFSGQDFYNDQVSKLAAWLKASKPREGFDEVLLPGEPEQRTHLAREKQGIPVEDDTWSKLQHIAEELGVAPLNA